MVKAGKSNATYRLHDRIIATVVVFALFISTFAVVGPITKAGALSTSDAGKISFDDANVNYDSDLKDNGDGTYTLDIGLWSDITKDDESKESTKSSDGYFEAQFSGDYLVELWGGSGASGSATKYNNGGNGGKGGHLYGVITLNKGDILYYNIGGNGTQTQKEDDGGGVNGSGGGHGNLGSYKVGGGGGYSAVYLFHNGTEANSFKTTYLDTDGNLVKKTIDESDRTSKYIMIAAGGGGGGAGDGFILGYKPTGTADGGNGGSITGTTSKAISNGTVFYGQDGKSSGKKTTYIGKGATEVPGVVTKDFGLGIVKGDKPNDWAGTANPELPGGAGAAGDLRGGAGGAGYMGASGGNMASLLNAGYIGGGGGGSSFISNLFTYNASSISDTVKNRESSSSTGGAVDITFIGADKTMNPTKDFSWLNELTFTANASKYFDVTASSTDGTAAVSGQQITLKNAKLGEDGKVHLTLTFTPKAAFVGGNNVNLFENTTTPEITVNNKNSTKTSSIDLSNDVTYVNVPLQNLEAIGNTVEIMAGDDVAKSALYEDNMATTRTNFSTNSNYDFIGGISEYWVKDYEETALITANTLSPTDSTVYTVGYTVTPKYAAAAIGTPVTATDIKTVAFIDVISEIVLNGITYKTTKKIAYDEATNTYTLTVTLNTSTRTDKDTGIWVNESELTQTQQAAADASAVTSVTKTSTGSATFTVPVSGYYLVQAWGANGGDGQGVSRKKSTSGVWGTSIGGLGGNGDYVYGYQYLTKGTVIDYTVGSQGTSYAGNEKAEKEDQVNGVGGGAGESSTIKINTIGLMVAGGGAGGGGAAVVAPNATGNQQYLTVAGYYVDDKDKAHLVDTANGRNAEQNHVFNKTTSYDLALNDKSTNGSNGTTKIKIVALFPSGRYPDDWNAIGGNAGIFGSSYNGATTDIDATNDSANVYKALPSSAKATVTAAATASKDSASGNNGCVKISLIQEDRLTTDEVKQNLGNRLTGITLDYELSNYFDLVSFTPSNYSFSDVVFSTVTEGDIEKTTATLPEVSWVIKFKPINGFLGGNLIPDLFYNGTKSYTTGIIASQDDAKNSDTGDGVADVPKNITTDNVNNKLTNKLSASVVTEEKRVQYGTVVPLTDLFALTDNWPDTSSLVDDYVAKVINTDFPEGGYTATANKTFTYTYGVKPVNETSKAKVDKLVSADLKTLDAKVVVFCGVTTNLTNMEYDGPTEVDLGTALTASVTPSAGYDAPTSITVKVNGSTITNYTYDSATGDLTIPASEVTGNIEISGTGVAKEYTLKYRGYNKDGVLAATKDVNYLAGAAITDETASLYTAPAVKGFKYVWDWQTDDGNALATMPASNYWVIGSYEPLFYTVQIKYVDTDGNEIATKYEKDVYYTYEDSVNSPDIDGYKLVNAADVKVDINIDEDFADAHAENDVVLYKTVVYELSDHNLSVKHTYTDTNETFDITYEKVNPGSTYNVAAQTIPGYVSDVSAVSGTMGTEKVNAEIKYSPATYEVSFDVDGSSYGTPINVTFKDEYGTLPTPTKAGKTFDGWYTADDTLITATSVVTATDNHTLYAKWIELPEFTVTQTPTVWTNGNVSFELTGTNTMVDYSGVTFYYSLDNGTTYTSMTTNTLVISDEGKTNVKFKAVIDTREYEDSTSYVAKIDKTSPSASINITTSVAKTILGGIFEKYFKETVNATITSSDAIPVGLDTSGVAKVEYYVANNPSSILTEGELNAITTWTEGSSVSVDPDKKAVIYAKVTDNAGNVKYDASYGFITDKTAPEITDTDSVNNRWFKDGAVVKVHVSDLLAGLDTVQIKVGDGAYTDATVDSDGNISISVDTLSEGLNSVTVKATDKSTNEKELALTIGRDNTAPTGTVAVATNSWTSLLSTLTFGLFFNNTQDVTITAEDTNGSGIRKIEYYVTDKLLDATELDAVTAWSTYTDGSVSLNPDGKYVVYAKLIDKVDNYSYISTNGIVVDTYGPTLTVAYDYDSKWITTADKTITGNVEKHYADVDTVSYAYTVNGTNKTGTLTFDADGNFSMPVTDDGKYVVTFTATDKAGNTERESKTVTVWKDSVKPIVTVSSPSTDWVKYDTTIVTVPTIGVSNIGSVQYKKSDEDGWHVISVEGTQYKTNIFENGEYQFRVISVAGKTSDIVSVTYDKIDNVVPVVEVSAQSNSKNYNFNTAPWTNNDVVFTLSNSADNLSPITYKYKVSTDASFTDLASNTFTDQTNGTTTYDVIAVSASGVESAPVTVKASVDKENPTGSVSVGTNTWTEFISAIDFLNIFYKDPVAVTVDGTDTVSGISGKYYLIDHTGQSLDYIKTLTTGWTTYTGSSFTIENENNYVIYVMLIDKAGNKTYLSTNGIKIDKTEPTINVSYAEGAWDTSSEVNIPVTIVDDANGCGVNETSITYTYSSTAPAGFAGTTKTAASATFTIPNADVPNGEYTITISAADKVGNIKTRDVKIKRDSEGITVIAKPQDVTVTYGDATATFTINAKSTSGLTYQWEKYNATSNTWETIDGATGSSYTVSNPSVVANNGDQYRVILSSEAGWSVNDTAATLTVNKKLITVSPDNQSVDYGQDDAELTYTYSGVINSDAVQFTGSFERTPGEEIGSYVITSKDFALDPTVEVNKNYYIEVNPTTADYEIVAYNPGVTATLENKTAGQNGWTISEVKITAPAGYKISTSNALEGNTWSDYITVPDGEYGSGVEYYLINVTEGDDHEGSISVKLVTTGFKQDTVAPDARVTVSESNLKKTLNGLTFGHFFKDTVGADITNANGTDISGLTYCYYISDSDTILTDTELNALADSVWTTGTGVSVNPDQKAIIYAKVEDGAGHVSYARSYGFIADATAPTLTDTNSADGKWITDENANVTVSVSDALAGLDTVKYTVNGGTAVTATVSAGKIEIPASALSGGTNTVVVKATDNSTNEATLTLTLKKDTTAPTVDATVDNTTIEQSKTITITPTVGDSNIKSVTVKKMPDGTVVDITNTYMNGFVATENGEYLVTVTNGAGESAQDTVTIDKIDTSKPVASISTGSYTEGEWSTSPVVINADNTNADNLGTTTYQYSTDGGNTWQDMPNGTLTLDDGTNGTYLVKAISESGVESDPVSVNVKVDTSAPTGKITVDTSFWEELLSTITFGIYKNDKVTVKIEGTFDISGQKSIEYIKTTDVITSSTELAARTDWVDYNGTFEIPAVDQAKFVIYAKLTDNAGNVTYVSSDGHVFDLTDPVITVSSNTIATTDDNGTTYADRTVTVSDSNLDTVKVYKDGVEVTPAPQISNGTATINIPNDGSTYEVVATDKGGNSVSITINTKTVDDFIDELDDSWADPTAPTENNLKDAINKIDDFVDAEDNNLTQEEKDKLQQKRDELLSQYAEKIANRYGIVVIDVQSDVVDIDDDAVKATLKKFINGDDVEKFLDGQRVEIVMTVTQATGDSYNEAKAEEDGNAIIKHIEVKIVKNVYAEAGDTTPDSTQTLTTTQDPIEFTVSADNYAKDGRVFFVYRDHANTSTKYADTDSDLSDDIVGFSSSLFSIFTLAYVPDATITGNATGKNDLPMVNATVELLDSNGDPVLDDDGNPVTTTTDEDGNFSFDNVPDGDYKIKVTTPDSSESTTENVTVNPDGTSTPVDVNFPDYNTVGDISGTVKDKDGNPVPGATVELLDKDGNPVLDGNGNPMVTTTDADGNYLFENVPEGEYKVRVTPPDGSDPSTSDNITVQNGNAEGEDVSLDNYQRYTDISGTVVDKNGDPVKGATVNLLDKNGNPVLDEDGNPRTTTTDENGKYTFNKVEIGNYQIEVIAPHPDKDGNTDTTTTKISVANGDVKDEDANSYPESTGVTSKLENYQAFTDITGNVTDKNGKPAEGILVELLDRDGNPVLDENGNPITTTTDENGDYIFSHIPDGEYTVKINSPVEEDEDVKAPVEVSNGTVIGNTNTKFDNYNAYGDINGNVKDENGKPQAGAKVELLDKDGNPITLADGTPLVAYTDKNGNYIFKNVPNGTYQVRVTLPDGRTEIKTVIIENGQIPLAYAPNFEFEATQPSPNTGDSNSLLPSIALLVMSTLGSTLVIKKRKEDGEENN